MSRTSAVAAALAVWAGTFTPLPWWTAAGAALVLLAAAVVARGAGPPDGAEPAVAGAEERSDSTRRLAVVLCALWLAGGGLAGGRIAMRDGGPLQPGAAASAVTEAVVVTEPRSGAYDAWMVVRVERFGDRRIRQRALLRMGDAPPIGGRLVVRARVTALPDGPFGSYLRGLGVGVELAPVGRVELSVAPTWALRTTSLLRDRVRAAATAALPSERAALLTGLVTGDGRGRSAELDDLLTDAGLRHLVVVSGRHTALFLAGVLGAAFVLRLPFRTARLTTLAALGWFIVLVRWQPSVLRAGAVAGFIILADLLGRDRDRVHLLALAVVVLLLADPLLGRQFGFVLSVAATAGVLMLAPLVHTRMRGPPWWRIGVGVAVGAQVAVAPVLVAMDEPVPLGGVLANLVAAPAAAVAQVVGSVAALVAVPAPDLAIFVARLASWPLGVVLWAAEVAGRVPDAQAVLARPGVVPALTAVVIGALSWRRLSGGWRWAVVAGGVLVAVVALVPRSAAPVDVLTVTLLDVGQGDAVLVEAPGEGRATARMLVDGGPADADVADLLAWRGVRTLDVVVATHAHADHTGGLPAVLRRLDVGALVTAPLEDAAAQAGGPDQASGLAPVLSAGRGRSVAHVPLSAGAAFSLGRAQVRILSPPPTIRGWDENNRSLVLRVDGAHGSVLLTGDIEEDAQRRLLREPEQLRVDVLKVPHHGGDTNAAGFLAATDPDVALISAGEGNAFDHPHPEVLVDLSSVTVRRTDQEGEVVIPLD